MVELLLLLLEDIWEWYFCVVFVLFLFVCDMFMNVVTGSWVVLKFIGVPGLKFTGVNV
jgi:hypothetical protein